MNCHDVFHHHRSIDEKNVTCNACGVSGLVQPSMHHSFLSDDIVPFPSFNTMQREWLQASNSEMGFTCDH